MQSETLPPLATIAIVQSRAAISLPGDLGIIQLKASAEPVAIDVECDVEWTAHSKANWLTLTPEKGKLTITPAQNPTGETRKERVTVSVGAITQSFFVEQQGAVVSPDAVSVELSAVETNRTVVVAANVVWEVSSNASWLTAGNANGKLSLSPTANTGDTRSAEVFITAGSIRKIVRVTQFNVYESLRGTWTISGQAVQVKEGVSSLLPASYKVTLLEDVKNSSFRLKGYGAGYLASTTDDSFTLDFNASKSTVSITMGETIGTFVFNGFTQDPEGKALVKTVFLQLVSEGGRITINTGLDGGEIVTGTIAADLNKITFEPSSGMGFGMWANSTKAWTGFFCSYRMFGIVLSRGEEQPSAAAPKSSNQFIYVGR